MEPSAAHDTSDTAEYFTYNELMTQFYESEPRVRVQVEVAGMSHPGLVRQNNEDHFIAVRRYRGREVLQTSLPNGLLASNEDDAYALGVADGMGGHEFGELASLLALLTGWELGGDEIKWPLKMNDREEEELRHKAEVFFRTIHQKLHAEVRENPCLRGMGTTLTLCYSTGPDLFVMHVGDSRAYLQRGSALRRLTRDHNLAQMLIDAGEAEPDSPELARVRHVLTNCLGGPDASITVDVHRHRLADGDRVLLCTDGLSDLVGDAEIAMVLERLPVPDDACRALVNLALERGGRDNVTVVVARYQLEDR